jgi:hypothetical protein
MKAISFRVTDDEWKAINDTAQLYGMQPNPWCQQLVLSHFRKMPEDLALIYEEIARLRYLLGNLVMSGLKKELNGDRWQTLLLEADRNGAAFAAQMRNARERIKRERELVVGQDEPGDEEE